MNWRIQWGVVWVLGGLLFTVDGSDLITETYWVPSDFFSAIPENDWNPKADLIEKLQRLNEYRRLKPAMEVLEAAFEGNPFGEGRKFEAVLLNVKSCSDKVGMSATRQIQLNLFMDSLVKVVSNQITIAGPDGTKGSIEKLGYLTDQQFQVFIRLISQTSGIDITSLPSMITSSLHSVILQRVKQRYGIIPVVSTDAKSAEYFFFIPSPGEDPFAEGEALDAPIVF